MPPLGDAAPRERRPKGPKASTVRAKGGARRDRVLPLLLAGGAHGALLASLAEVKVREPPQMPAPTTTELFEIDEPQMPAERTDSPPSRPDDGASARSWLEPRAGTRGHAKSAAEPSAIEAPAPTLENWTFSPTTAAGASVDLQLGSQAPWQRELVRRSAAGFDPNTMAEPDRRARSATGGVAEDLQSADLAAGITRGGALLTAAEDAARADPVIVGEATFEVVIWRDGTSDVRLVSASEETEAWGAVASQMASEVKGRKVRFSPGADGLRVTLRLNASSKLADGRDVRSLHGPRAALAPSILQQQLAADSKEQVAAGPALPDHGSGGQKEVPAVGGELGPSKGSDPRGAVLQGLAQRVLPTPTVSVSGKVCSATVSLTPVGIGIGGGCSVENIGTPPTHAVSGRIVREEAMHRADAGSAP